MGRKKVFAVLWFFFSGCASHKAAIKETPPVAERPAVKLAPLPSEEVIKEFVQQMELRTITGSAENQAAIETIWRIIARADLVELRQAVEERQVFPIQDETLKAFWHIILITAYILKSNPFCEQRAAYWREEVANWPVPQRNLFLAAGYFLVERHYPKTYRCPDGADQPEPTN